MKKRTVKAWFWVHKWTSLVSTVFILMLCLTGLPLIFHHELDHALGDGVEPPALAGPAGPANVDAILQDARSRAPGDAVIYIVKDAHEPELIYISMGERPESVTTRHYFTYDARTGALLDRRPMGQGVMSVISRLHIDLFAGIWGMLLYGFMGLLLIASIISGVVIYSPYRKRVAFGLVRRSPPRLLWADLHNLLGMVSLVWFFVVGLTGVLNTLSIPIYNYWQGSALSALLAQAEASLEGDPSDPGSAGRALQAAEAAAPNMQMSFMAFPKNPWAGPHHFVVYMVGETPLTAELITPFVVDGRRGEVVATAELPWYFKLLMGSRPLHFGNYGGLPLKILWALLDLLSIIVVGSGLYLWLRRSHLSFEAWWQKLRAGPKEHPA